jgi:very-short-patch-repair endonuclease
VHAGVYRVFPARSHRDLLAGALAALPTAVVSHSSAARLHELDGLPDGFPTVTVHASKAYRFPDVDVRRTRTLIDAHTVEVDGLSTTTVARTLVDLAADLRPSRWQHLAERVVVHGVCTLDDVRAVAEVACGRGVAGSKIVRAFLEDPLAGTSRLERLAIEALRLAGLPRPELQYPIPWDPGKRFDLAYPRARLAIELDGRRWHSEREVFQTDRRRDREALVRGWIVPRFTFDDVVKRPEQFVRTTAELLAERSVD